MGRRRMRRAWFAVAVFMFPLGMRGEHRFALQPSIQVVEVADNNLNFNSLEEPQRDRIRRITPSVALRLDSPRWSARGSYALDSEQFATHSRLDNDRARERADIAIQYQAGPRLMLSMDGGYMDTNTLADLNVDTGLAASRVHGRRISFGPSAHFRISPRVTATASASSITTNVVNGIGLRTQGQRLGLERRVTPTDAFSLDYERSHLVFVGATSQSILTQTLLAGWSRDLGAHDRLTFHVGPRITEGSSAADVSASLMHSWRFSSMAISLLRNQTTVIGYSGAVDTQSAQAKFSYAPNRRLIAYAEPAILRSTHHQLEGTVYRIALGARYAVTPLLGADVAYSIDKQNGAIDTLRANTTFSHATLSVGFTTRWNSSDRMR
jgi:hypothetical protein